MGTAQKNFLLPQSEVRVQDAIVEREQCRKMLSCDRLLSSDRLRYTGIQVVNKSEKLHLDSSQLLHDICYRDGGYSDNLLDS